MNEPKFENSSEARVFLAHFQEHDLYFDPQTGVPTIIARFGDEGPDYISGLHLAASNPVIAEGRRLAVERGLLHLPEDFDLVLKGWSPRSNPTSLVPSIVTRHVHQLDDGELGYEIRLQKWPWEPYATAGWRWDLFSPDSPYLVRAFGYERSIEKAERVAASNAMIQIAGKDFYGSE